jgi:acyl-CoA hydrolase
MEPWQLVTGISVLLGIGGTAVGVWATLRTQRRAEQSETRSEAASMTVIAVKLEQLQASVNDIKVDNVEYRTEIKTELRGNRDEMRELRERMVAVEASAKQAHHRIDRTEGKEA